jgi:hypothetical protein
MPEQQRNWPRIRQAGSDVVHSVNAAGGPQDGSLYGFRTFCGRAIEGDQEYGWIEQGTPDFTTQFENLRDCRSCDRTMALNERLAAQRHQRRAGEPGIA